MQIIAPVTTGNLLAADQLPLLKFELYFPDNRLGTKNFVSGSVEPVVNEILTGAISAATAKVFSVNRTGGAWGDGDASGSIELRDCSGCFHDTETINGSIGGLNILTVDHDDGEVGVDRRVKNGAFVHDIDPPNGWTEENNVDCDTVVGGQVGNCAKVLENGANNPQIMQQVIVEPGKTYEFTFYHNDKDGTNDDPEWRLHDQTNGVDIKAWTAETAIVAWTLVTYTFEAPALCVAVRIYLRHSALNTDADAYYFDEITLYELDEWINLNALVAENYVEGESLSLGGASMTPNPVEGIWSTTLFNQDGIFHPQHPTSAYKDYFKTERQARLSIGATYGGTDYYWQRVIGYMDEPKFNTPDYRVAISGGDYMKRLQERELRMPDDNYWGLVWTTSSISTDGATGIERYTNADPMRLVGEDNTDPPNNWVPDACTFETVADIGGTSAWVAKLITTDVEPYVPTCVLNPVFVPVPDTQYAFTFKYNKEGGAGASLRVSVKQQPAGRDWIDLAQIERLRADDWPDVTLYFTAQTNDAIEIWLEICNSPLNAEFRFDKFSIFEFVPYWERYYDLRAHDTDERGVHHVMLKPNATWEDVWQGEEDEGWWYAEDAEAGPEPPAHPAGIVFFDPNKTVAAGANNLKIYYFTQQEAEDVVARLLFKAGVADPATGAPYVDEAAALVAIKGHVEYVCPNVQIDKVWFKPGTTCLQAIMKICERCDYRFYFDYDGTPVFMPKPVAVDPADFIFTSPKHVASIDTYQDRGEIKNRIVIRGMKQAEPVGREETRDSDYYTGEASDATSIAAYGERTLTINNHLFQDNIDNITGVTVGGAGAGEFKVAGDLTARYLATGILIVKGSTNNDGIYTISAGGSTHAAGTTTIPVDEAVAAVADGTIHTQTAIAAMCTSLLAEYKDPKWYSTLKMPFNPVPLVMGDTIQWEERLSSNLDITQIGVIRDIKIDNFDTTYKCERIGPGSGGSAEFLDDFCSPAIGYDWTTHALNANKTITIDPETCILTIEIKNEEDAVWYCLINNLAPKMYKPLTVKPPCRIITKLLSMPPDPGASCPDDVMAGIFIGTDPEGLGIATSHLAFLWGRYRSSDEGADCLRLARNCGMYGIVVNCGPGCLPKWLMIHIDASEDMRFYYSDDGVTWAQFEHMGEPFVLSDEYTDSLYVGLFAKNGIYDPVAGGDTNVAASFEFFRIDKFAGP